MKQRIITAVIAMALFIPLVVMGSLPFVGLVFILSAIALYEMLNMKHIKIWSFPGIIALITLSIFLLSGSWSKAFYDQFDYSKIDLALMAVLVILTYTVIVKNRFTFEDAAFTILSTIYIGVGFFYFIETRESGIAFVIYALMVIWLTDSGAYFIGKQFGKRKLWPDISPNKTIEGFIGGIITAIIGSIVFYFVWPLGHSIIVMITVTFFASIIGQLGDLVESAIKRHYGVKDSGHLLPGHGGILDRFDSLLFVLPLLHYLHFI